MQRDVIEKMSAEAEVVVAPASRKHEPYRPFPVHVLPEPVRSFVVCAAQSIGCDAAYVAMPLLAALASLIGNSRRIQLKVGWVEPPVLWMMLVGESGSQKTPAFRAAMRVIRDLQRDALRVHAEKQATYEREMQEYEKALAAWKKSKEKSDPPTKPKQPQPARFIVSDTTVEAIAVTLKANWRGLLLARDELGGWIGSFDRYVSTKGTDATNWLSMFGAETLIVDRKTGPDPVLMVDNAAVCIAGGIQPGPLHRALGQQHRENGLLARFLLAWPPRRAKRWSDCGIPPEQEAVIGQLCDRLLELTPEVYEDRIDPVIVRLSPDAKRLWVQFYDEHAQQQVALTGDMAAMWSKIEGYAARLALVFHCVRWAADDATLADASVVDEVSLQAGIDLARWFGNEAKRVYALLGSSREDQQRHALIEIIERKGGRVSVRDWQQCRSHPTSTAAEAELVMLAQAGYGTLEFKSQSGRGRPSKVFTLASYTYENTDSASPAGFSFVSEEDADPRREVAVLLRAARRAGDRPRAVAIRDAVKERVSTLYFDRGLTEEEARRLALFEVVAEFGAPTPGTDPSLNGHATGGDA